MSRENVIGAIFGKLTLRSRINERWKSWKKKNCICLCECGNVKSVRAKDLFRGKSKSCGCGCNNPNISFIDGRKFNPMISSALMVFRQTYSDGDLTFEQFYKLSQLNCYYCNTAPLTAYNVFITKKRKSQFALDNGMFIYNGLDRVNSKGFHTLNNVVPCCWGCNNMKGKMTINEFKTLISSVYNNFVANDKLFIPFTLDFFK